MPESPNGSCFFFGDFPLCGCGQPDKALDFILEILTEAGRSGEGRRRLTEVAGGEEGIHWLAVYALDHADLIEHGGTIGFAWLTAKGDAALAYLNAYGTNPDAWPVDVPVEWSGP